MGNLLSIKAILRGFELASSFKVNFSKSYINVVNVGRELLNLV